MARRGKKDFKCSFCGKPNERVRKLIGGPGVYICDECVAVCNDILSEPGTLDEPWHWQQVGPDWPSLDKVREP